MRAGKQSVSLIVAWVLILFSGWSLFGSSQGNTQVRLPVTKGSDVLFVALPYTMGPARNSHSTIVQIVSDDQGFLWFGTQDGLKRYDGYSFRDFRSSANDVGALRGTSIGALFKDRSGKLWVAVDDHLERYDPQSETFTHISGPDGSDQPVNGISEDRQGAVWLATNQGLNRIDPITGEIKRFRHQPRDQSSLGSDMLRCTFEQPDGTFWVASESDLEIFDRATARVIRRYSFEGRLPSNRPNPSVRLFQDHAGVLWVASSRDGLAVVDRQNERLVFLQPDRTQAGRQTIGVNAISEDRAGTLWLGTNGDGLLKLSPDRKRFVNYRHDPYDPDSLSSDQLLSVLLDHEDDLWLGTGGGGIMRIPAQPLPFQRFQNEPGNPRSIGTDSVSSVFEDAAGVIWVGGRGTLTSIDRDKERYSVHKLLGRASSVDVLSIVKDRTGRLWFGTRGEGLMCFDTETGKSIMYRHDPADSSSLSHDTVFALLLDSRGTIWAGTEDGLDAFDPNEHNFRTFRPSGVSPERIRGISEDASGTLWLATWLFGVHRFDPTTGVFTIFRHGQTPESLSSDGVAAILVSHSGIVWAGTENGLNRIDPATRTFKAYTVNDGLPNNNVNGILEDRHGDLWITTHNGLSHFNPYLHTFRNYYRTDGVLGDFLSVGTSPSGELLFGAASGFTALVPSTITESSYVPPIVLTALDIAGKAARIGSDLPLTQSISLTKSITLPYRENSLSFEFSALGFASPERTRYRYKLEGLENNWNEVDSSRRFARYTTVAPSTYVFRVQSRGKESTWRENGVAVRITVLPPWWRTWQFGLLCMAMFGTVLWRAYAFRVQQIAVAMDARFEERLRERSRIARELHDTLLQSFQGSLFEFQAAQKLFSSRPEEARPALNRAIDSARAAIAEGREAIQGLRTGLIDGERLPDLLKAAGKQCSEAQPPNEDDIAFHVTVEGPVEALDPVLQDELYRISQELLRNAFRHAHAKRIEVEIRYSPGELRLRVRDDGSGIDPRVLDAGGRPGHWGIPGVRERVKLIGAEFDLWSEAAAGTEIQITVPAARAYARSRSGPFRLFSRTPQPYAVRARRPEKRS